MVASLTLYQLGVGDFGARTFFIFSKLHPTLSKLLELPVAFQQKTFLCHYDETNFREQEIGGYYFLEQDRLYPLVG